MACRFSCFASRDDGKRFVMKLAISSNFMIVKMLWTTLAAKRPGDFYRKVGQGSSNTEQLRNRLSLECDEIHLIDKMNVG